MRVGTSSGQMVNAATAENLSGVLACVGAVASTLGSLPAYVYRGTPAGRQEAPDHPLARLVRRPNDWQTWPDYVEWTAAQALLQGNAVSEIVHDGAGRPMALVPIPWGNVSPVMLPGGRLALDVVGYQGHGAERGARAACCPASSCI
jgi:HK97 family phage portal protein